MTCSCKSIKDACTQLFLFRKVKQWVIEVTKRPWWIYLGYTVARKKSSIMPRLVEQKQQYLAKHNVLKVWSYRSVTVIMQTTVILHTVIILLIYFNLHENNDKKIFNVESATQQKVICMRATTRTKYFNVSILKVLPSKKWNHTLVSLVLLPCVTGPWLRRIFRTMPRRSSCRYFVPPRRT